MGAITTAPRPLSRELSVAGSKPKLRGIHHLALVTDDMRMTLDFHVRVLAMSHNHIAEIDADAELDPLLW
jgi:hypothetical protein